MMHPAWLVTTLLVSAALAAEPAPDEARAAAKPAAAKKAPVKHAEKKGKPAPPAKPSAPPKPAAPAKAAPHKEPEVYKGSYSTTHEPIRDTQGHVIPTDPDAYDVSSALTAPKKK